MELGSRTELLHVASLLEAEIVSESDPTDHALAAIASILDQPLFSRKPDKAAKPPKAPEKAAVEEKPVTPELVEAGGYQKIGPGPIAAIRFRWTVRREGYNQYYVDETIGEHSTPIVTGPLTSEAAIRFVDDRESEARQRFEQLKSEMAGRGAAARLARKDAGEM
jgi:hypothetical protein